MVLDQIFAQRVRVADEVSQSTSSVGSSFLLLILQEFDEELDTRPEMLVEHFVVETSVSDCKACKFPRITIWISATFNGSRNQAVLKQFLVEEAGVAAEVSNQVAYLGPDAGVLMLDQVLQVGVDVRVVDWIIELF